MWEEEGWRVCYYARGACRVCLRHAGFSLEYLRWVMVGKADRLLAQSSWE